MVQLEADGTDGQVLTSEFQFQHGTIRSMTINPEVFADLLFQFQHGTIRSLTTFVVDEAEEVSIPAWYN